MTYKSKIVTTLEKIYESFDDFLISHYSKAFDYYTSLPAEEKDIYIEKYEKFFYSYGMYIFSIKDLLLVAKKLENISIEHEKARKSSGTGFADSKFWPDNYENIFHLTSWFCNAITILIKITEGNRLINLDDLKVGFPEMMYIKAMRNEFLQHPKFHIPFHMVNASQIPGDRKKIPFATIAPGGGGLTLLTSHHFDKIQNQTFLQKKGKEQEQMNKDDFRNFSYQWNNGNVDEDLLHRIKSVGLPTFDQDQLSQELETFFSSYIMPFIKTEWIDAKNNGILFD